MMKLVLLALCVLYSEAAPAAPLGNGTHCAPDQWETLIMQTTGYSGKEDGSIDTATWFAYDYTNKREASYTNSTSDSGVYVTLELKDYNKGLLYKADPQKKTCDVSRLPKKMERGCLPDDAKIIGQWLNGKDKVAGVKFSMDKPHPMQITNFGDVKTGLPISQTVMGVNENGYTYFAAQMFLNSSLGIEHPHMFDVPSYCKKAEEAILGRQDCGPEQWEATILGQYAYNPDNGTSGVIDSTTWFSYDHKNARTYGFINSTSAETGSSIMIELKDYKNGMKYMANVADQTCEVTKMTEQMYPPCGTANATMMGAFTSGSDVVGAIMEDFKGFRMLTYGTEDTKLPVSQILTGRIEEAKTSYMMAQMFMNARVGISDVTVFTPPSYCKKVDTAAPVIG